MRKLTFIWTSLLLSSLLLVHSCASDDSIAYKSNLTGINSILSDQRLTVRAKYIGLLTNRAGESIAKHDLNVKSTRDSLRSLLFACRIGGMAFHICGDRAGFCRNTSKCIKWKKRFLRKKKCVKTKVVYYSIDEDFNFLLSVKATCMSRITYPAFVREI